MSFINELLDESKIFLTVITNLFRVSLRFTVNGIMCVRLFKSQKRFCCVL